VIVNTQKVNKCAVCPAESLRLLPIVLDISAALPSSELTEI
jgi:hypothetical protein